jgi:hypothetical protein
MREEQENMVTIEKDGLTDRMEIYMILRSYKTP